LFSGNKYLLTLMIGVCVTFYVIAKMPWIEHSDWWSWISARKGDAAHTSIVLCGIIVTLLFFDNATLVTKKFRFLDAFAFAIFLFIAGYFLRPWFKISKIYATPTWCLYSAAFCTIIFSFLYWLIDRRKVLGWTNFFKPAASNPLLTYIIPDIIYYVTALLGIVIVPHFLRSGWPGILWSAFFAVAVMGIVILLNKMKLKLQL
jgi:heparan-alpha-glucosaminide N-acetyltransferase